MASIPVVSGGSQPVFAIDTRNGPQEALTATYTPAGVPTNFAGPALDFFGISNISGIQNQAQVNGAVQQIFTAIQGTATIAVYQANTNTLSIATYPVGAFGTDKLTSSASLQSTIRALGNIQVTNNGVTTGFDVSNAKVVDNGFYLV